MDGLDPKPQSTQGPNSRFPTNSWSLHKNVEFPQTKFLGLVGSTFGRRLGCKGCGLLSTTKSQTTGGGPRKGIAAEIGDGNNGIVESRLNEDIAFKHNLLFFLLLRFGQNIPRLLLLVRDGLPLALTGAGVRLGTLASDRKPLAVPQSPVATNVHQPLDVQRGFGP